MRYHRTLKWAVALTVVSLLVTALPHSSEIALARQPKHRVVTPSGDTTGVQDADAIELALRQVKRSGQEGGGVVDLAAGDYYVGRRIHVPNFSGVLTGAGKHQTFIHVVENSHPGSFMAATEYWEGWSGVADTELSMLFDFDISDDFDDAERRRSITIRDMTITVTADPAEPYLNDFLDDTTTGLNNVAYISGGSFDTRFENLAIVGEWSEVNPDEPSVLWPLGVAGGPRWDASEEDWGEGNHELVNVDFNRAIYGYEGWNWKAGSFLVEGCSFENMLGRLDWFISRIGPDVVVTTQS